MPVSDGNAGETIVTDGNGTLSWYDGNNTTVLKDVVSWSNPSETINAGAWTTMHLNTLQGASSFVSILNDTLTLQAGTYYIDASIPLSTTTSVAPSSIKSGLFP